MFLCNMRMTRMKSGFHMCRMLLISRVLRTSKSLGWPSTSCQLLYNTARFWLIKKAFLGIPKRTFFLWDAPVVVKNMPQGMFYFSLLWSQLIIPYTASYFYLSLLILNNYKDRISHLHAVTINVLFPQLWSISKKMQLAPHKYSGLINFSMHTREKKF